MRADHADSGESVEVVAMMAGQWLTAVTGTKNDNIRDSGDSHQSDFLLSRSRSQVAFANASSVVASGPRFLFSALNVSISLNPPVQLLFARASRGDTGNSGRVIAVVTVV